MKNLMAPAYTLIEVLVTVAVMAVTLTIGVPSFRQLIQNNQMTSHVNELAADINFARSEALKRGAPVSICKRNAVASACDTSAAWMAGWIIFADADSDGVIDTGDEILRIHDSLSGLQELNFTLNKITFDGSAFSTDAGTFTFCDDRGPTKAKGLVLSNPGRLRIAISSDTLSCPNYPY